MGLLISSEVPHTVTAPPRGSEMLYHFLKGYWYLLSDIIWHLNQHFLCSIYYFKYYLSNRTRVIVRVCWLPILEILLHLVKVFSYSPNWVVFCYLWLYFCRAARTVSESMNYSLLKINWISAEKQTLLFY